MMKTVTICQHGECGGDCYRCRCRRLVEEADQLRDYATRLRQAIRAMALGEITILESAPGLWVYRVRGRADYEGPFGDPVSAATNAVADTLGEADGHIS